MATLRLNQPYEAGTYHDQYNVGGKSIIIQPWYIDPEGNFTQDEYTLVYRGNSGRRGFGSLDNLFINRIREVARIWRDVLSAADRAAWTAVAFDRSGARPGMPGPGKNGWTLFAEYALAIVAWPVVPAFDWTVYEGWGSRHQVFYSAVAATQILTLWREYDVFTEGRSFWMIHQTDPKHIGKRDSTRRTFLVGYHSVTGNLPAAATFTAQAVYPFEAGDTVSVLLREHVSSLEVRNFELQITAT